MSNNNPHPTALKPHRSRGWSIVSNALTREMIEEFVTAHPNDRAHGAVHDRDPGTKEHGHIFFYSKTQRTTPAIRRKFPVPVIVKPFIAHPGEPGTDRGKFAMARGARYNTHEHPEQQSRGKARYSDDEMIATPGWNWRAEVDALNARENIDPERPARLSLIERYADRVVAGELTARDVHRQNKKIYLSKSTSYWAVRERQAAEWKRQDTEAAELQAREARRHLEQAEQAEQERRLAEQAEHDHQAAVERQAAQRARARQLAEEHAAHAAALKAEQATPEYQERLAAEQIEGERVDLIDLIAMLNGVKGSRSTRSADATSYAAELALTSSEHVREDGELTHRGAVLTYAEVSSSLEPARAEADIDNVMLKIRSDIRDHRRDMSQVGLQLAGAEMRAAEGELNALETALHLRETYSSYTDLITLPSPRSDIKNAWRDQLLAVS